MALEPWHTQAYLLHATGCVSRALGMKILILNVPFKSLQSCNKSPDLSLGLQPLCALWTLSFQRVLSMKRHKQPCLHPNLEQERPTKDSTKVQLDQAMGLVGLLEEKLTPAWAAAHKGCILGLPARLMCCLVSPAAASACLSLRRDSGDPKSHEPS